MAMLGKCLVFSLRYWPEMNRYHWKDEKEEPKEFENVAEVQKMIQEVGTQSVNEAQNFLTHCAARIEPILTALGVRHEKKTEKSRWGISYGLKSGREREFRVKVGLEIPRLGKAVVLPWIWCKGEREAEDRILDELGEPLRKTRDQSQELDWEPETGTVPLAIIPILSPNHEGFEVETEPLLRQVEDSFKVILPRNLDNLFNWSKAR